MTNERLAEGVVTSKTQRMFKWFRRSH